jgi:hypothetical protein
MGKIKIELSAEEVAVILKCIQEHSQEISNSEVLLKKITDAKNDSDKRNEINDKVKKVIHNLSHLAIDQIEDAGKLMDYPILLIAIQMKTLGSSFTYIAQQYKTLAVIGMDEAAQLGTVQDCVELIMKRIK